MSLTTPNQTMNSPVAEQTFLQKHGQKLIGAAIWVAVFALYFSYTRINNLTFAESFTNLGEALSGPIGPILFVFIYILRPVLFFPASLLTVASGTIFGVWGILWTIIGSNLSSLVAYVIGRFFGEGLISDDGDGIVQKYATRMRENAFETVLIMRFIYLPYDLVTYIAGILKIDWKQFILATALGAIPGTAFFVLVGASFDNLENALSGQLPSFNPWVFAASIAMFIASLLLSRYFRNRESKRAA